MTKGLEAIITGAVALGLGHSLSAQMQTLPHMHTAGGTIYVPESSIARPEDVGNAREHSCAFSFQMSCCPRQIRRAVFSRLPHPWLACTN